jgi:nucleotide-binding universal stress UspA family protein
MFGTVVVPLDGSREAEQAIPYAWDEAQRHGCALVLVRVVPRPELPADRFSHGGPASTGPLWAAADLVAAMEEATAYLRDVIRRHGLPRETEIVTPVGDPFRRLLEEIDKRTAPLVVLASETEPGSLTGALSETAHRLLLSGTAPVLQIRGPRHPSPSPERLPAPPPPPLLHNLAAAPGSWA